MASQEVVRPSVISGLKADLIEAVTNAYMAKRIPELSGLKFDRGECKDGEFRYKSPSADNALGSRWSPTWATTAPTRTGSGRRT